MTHKVAIVTGASRGIGAEIAYQLAQDGFAIVVNYANDQARAEQVVQNIHTQQGKAVCFKADVADAQQVKALFAYAIEQFGGVDVLVNNAGVMTLATIENTTDEMFEHQVNINFKGTFNTLREAATCLRDCGAIINFSTSVVGLKLEKYAIYAATKSAVETMTAIMAKELGGRNITINAVAPGPTETELFLNGKSTKQIEYLKNAIPLARLGQPQEIAQVVSFLASQKGGWINGQVIRANGGLV